MTVITRRFCTCTGQLAYTRHGDLWVCWRCHRMTRLYWENYEKGRREQIADHPTLVQS